MMRVSTLDIQWVPNRHLVHAWNGVVVSSNGPLRVAMLVDEHLNPRRPFGAKPPSKAYTLELYMPLRPKQDRVQKFDSDVAAKQAATRALLTFVNDVIDR